MDARYTVQVVVNGTKVPIGTGASEDDPEFLSWEDMTQRVANLAKEHGFYVNADAFEDYEPTHRLPEGKEGDLVGKGFTKQQPSAGNLGVTFYRGNRPPNLDEARKELDRSIDLDEHISGEARKKLEQSNLNLLKDYDLDGVDEALDSRQDNDPDRGPSM